jgi:hypothetical protein
MDAARKPISTLRSKNDLEYQQTPTPNTQGRVIVVQGVLLIAKTVT